jgi:hypothetical protein
VGVYDDDDEIHRRRKKKSKTTEKKRTLLVVVARKYISGKACAQQPETIESLRHAFYSFSSLPFLQKEASMLKTFSEGAGVGDSTNNFNAHIGRIFVLYRCENSTCFPFAFNYSGISYLFRLWHTFLRVLVLLNIKTSLPNTTAL